MQAPTKKRWKSKKAEQKGKEKKWHDRHAFIMCFEKLMELFIIVKEILTIDISNFYGVIFLFITSLLVNRINDGFFICFALQFHFINLPLIKFFVAISILLRVRSV